jgi:hypothetical protein
VHTGENFVLGLHLPPVFRRLVKLGLIHIRAELPGTLSIIRA